MNVLDVNEKKSREVCIYGEVGRRRWKSVEVCWCCLSTLMTLASQLLRPSGVYPQIQG